MSTRPVGIPRILREPKGEEMLAWKGRHKGEACAIIACGASLCETTCNPSEERVAAALAASADSGPMAVYHADRLYVLRHDLRRIQCPTMTVNRSWELLWPTYQLSLDVAHYKGSPAYRGEPEVYDRLAKEGRLFVMSEQWPVGQLIRF